MNRLLNGNVKPWRPLWLIMLVAACLSIASLSCSIGQAVMGRSTVPTPTKTQRPTFTPLPGALAPVPQSAQAVRGVLPPGVTVEPPRALQTNSGQFTTTLSLTPEATDGSTSLILFATTTPLPSPTPEPTSTLGPTASPTPDTETNRPTREAGPRALPTPYVVVNSATVNGRRGPANTFEKLGQANRGDELMIMGRVSDDKWWQVCCLANQPAWVPADAVTAKGPLDSVPVLTPPPTPRPTPRPAPTNAPTITPTPLPPFDKARGPEFPTARDDGRLVIRVKIYEGKTPYEKALPGYVLRVLRDGVDVTQSNDARNHYPSSQDLFDNTNPEKTGGYDYNYKFELPGAGEADWEIYLAKPDGYRVSPITKFTTKGDSYRNLEVYLAYWLAR